MGKLDILVNNAGITRDNLFMRMKDEEWEEVIAVNLTASFPPIARGAARHDEAPLRPHHQHHLGRRGHRQCRAGAIMPPSKAGLIGMSKSLAAEVASRNITVNCVAPGFIETAMTDVLNDKQREAILGSGPDGPARHRRRNRRRRRLPGLGRGRLRHRPDPARQWRNGNDLKAC